MLCMPTHAADVDALEAQDVARLICALVRLGHDPGGKWLARLTGVCERGGMGGSSMGGCKLFRGLYNTLGDCITLDPLSPSSRTIACEGGAEGGFEP